MNLYQPTISGSLTVSGSVEIIGPFTMSGGSISGTSSFAANAGLLQGLDSTSFVGTGSFNSMSSSVSTRVTKIEGNYATTGSNIFLGAQTVCANITSTGTIIAQTLNVQQVTSSVVYSSGSNVFGCSLANTQQFTGSVTMTGSLGVSGNTCVGGTITGTTVYGSTAICGGSVTGTCAVFSGNGLFGGSTNAGNAGTNTLSVGVPGTTAGGLQLWAATNQTHFIQFGDGTASADNYRGYIAYAHGTDTLTLGTAATDKLTISSTGAATFSGDLLVKNTSTIARIDIEAPSANSKNIFFKSTGNADNSVRLAQNANTNDFIIATGDGTVTPTIRLTIASTGAATFTCTVTTSNASVSATYGSLTVGGTGISIADDGNAKLQIGRFNSANCNAYIKMGINTCSLRFTNPGDTVDVVTFDKGGSVLIGTTATPVGKLDIATGGNTNVVISNDSTDTGYNIISLNGTRTKGSYAGIAGGGTGDGRLYLNSGVEVVIQTGASYVARMRTYATGPTCFSCPISITGAGSGTALNFGNSVANNILYINSYGGWSGIGMDTVSAAMRIAGDITEPNGIVQFGYYKGGTLNNACWCQKAVILTNGVGCFANIVCAPNFITTGGCASVRGGDPAFFRGSTVTQSGNSITFDAFRFLNPTGGVGGAASTISGRLYMSFHDTSTGGNQVSYQYLIITTGNGVSPGPYCFVQLYCGPVRGTNPISAISLVNDGSGGAVKVQATTAASGVAGAVAYITFVGTAV